MKTYWYILGIIVLFLNQVREAEGQKISLDKGVPGEFVMQYAGSVGFISVGVNYPIYKDYFDLSFLYGYVPKTMGGRLDIVSAKLQFKPFRVCLNGNKLWFPLNPVFFLSYTLNNNFYYRWPRDQYHKGYYWWNSALRVHGGFSSELKIFLNEEKIFKTFSFYLEANSNDLYLVSYFKNSKALKFVDVIKLGTGLKVGI